MNESGHIFFFFLSFIQSSGKPATIAPTFKDSVLLSLSQIVEILLPAFKRSVPHLLLASPKDEMKRVKQKMPHFL